MTTQRILIVLNIIFWSVVIFNNLGNHSAPKDTPKEIHQPLKQSQTLKTPDLNITFLDFADRYNSLLTKYNIPQFGLDNLHWKEDSRKKTFFCDLGDSVIIFGDVDNKTEKLLSVTVGCEPGKTYNEENTVKVTVLLHAVSIKALNPAMSKSELDSIGKKLSQNLKHGVVIDGNKKYQSVIYDKKLLLSIEPVDL